MNIKVSLINIFLDFFKKYPRQFSALFLLLLVEGIAATISVLSLVPLAEFMLDPSLDKPNKITSAVIDALSIVNLKPSFWAFGTLFILANLFKGTIEIIIRYSILQIKYIVLRGLFGDALETFFKSRWEFFSGSEQGVLLNTMSRELTTIGDTFGHLATLLAQFVQLGIYLLVPLCLNPGVTLTALGLAILFGTPFFLLHGISYRLGQKNTRTANEALGILSEVLSSARLILGFGRQDQARDRFLFAFNAHSKQAVKSQVLATAVPKYFHPMALLAMIIALGFSTQKQDSLSELAAVLWSLLAAMPILSALLQGNISISNFLPSYEQLENLRRRAAQLEEIHGKNIFNKLHQKIELKNVDFSYPGRDKTISGANLSIKKGRMTALVGESGSGKSTIVDLVMGLQIPNQGCLLIDEVPLNEWHINSFRERIGYVPQDPQLFHSSIRENLLWSLSEASDEDLWLALETANAAHFVRGLPEGMETIVGDRGVRLSGGQRQRIALARALLRKPELLVLDEATSALDSESEQLIKQSIELIAHDTTILIVAHRLSTISSAHHVYVMSKGRIVEDGSFAVLSKKSDGILNKMLLTQASL